MANNSSALDNLTIPLDACGWPLVRTGANAIQECPAGLRYLYLVLYPILLAVCTGGNVLNIMVLATERPMGSKNLYLVAIALLDLLFMWCALPSASANLELEFKDELAPAFRLAFDRLYGFTQFAQEVSMICSAWIIVAFSIERFMAIVRPMHIFGSSHTQLRNLAIIFGIVLVTSAIGSVRLIDYYTFFNTFLYAVPRPKFKYVRQGALAQWYPAYIWFLAINEIVTFLIILVLNSTILFELTRRRVQRQRELRATRTAAKRSNGSQIRTPASMLFSCVALHLICKLPAFLSNIFYIMEVNCVSDIHKRSYPILTKVVSIFFYIYCSFNFLLYCGASPKFRQRLMALCRCGGEDSRMQRSMSNGTKIIRIGNVSTKGQNDLNVAVKP